MTDIARIAYLTSPAPGRFLLNIQPEGTHDIARYEISKAHLANIVIDGASFALRETSVHRVQPTPQTENADERDAIS